MNKILIVWILIFSFTLALLKGEQSDLPIADFEGDSWEDWKVEGNAFGLKPVGNLPAPEKQGYWVDGIVGKGMANSSVGGRKETGKLISPEILIQRPYLQFSYAGELSPQCTVNLILNEQVVRTILPEKEFRPKALCPTSWDVKELQGKKVHIEIVDSNLDKGEFILVDHIFQTDAALVSSQFSLPVKNRFLLLPVKNYSKKHYFRLSLDGQMVREFDIELAEDGNPDWWASYDISPWIGKNLTVDSFVKVSETLVQKLPGLFQQSDQEGDDSTLYKEVSRPQFHFTPKRGWNNDPNGMVYFNGEYHLFYQYNPFGIRWGNMHWGHTVSQDLIHWTEKPIALYQRGLRDMAFSGGAIVDKDNRLGFGTGKEDTLIAFFTSTGRGECIAIGNKNFVTLKDYDKNPILKHPQGGRDPKVLWYEPEKKWIMIVYEARKEADQVVDTYAFYDSRDLRSWNRLSEIPGLYECPEFFELPVEGEGVRKWVIHGSERKRVDGKFVGTKSSYMIGSFDGKKFTPETPILNGHLGPCYYAAQTFSHVPDGRCIMMGWLSGANYPKMSFSQGMTVPLELKLKKTEEGLRLHFAPIKELENLRISNQQYQKLNLVEANAVLEKMHAELLDIRMKISLDDLEETKINIRGIPIIFNPATRELSCNGKMVQLPLGRKSFQLRAIVDRSVLELFIDEGAFAMAFGGDI
ncbi:MAG: glycoside hydrolase family 32 protein, partial [Verrucomicrobiota bacterium]